MLTAWAVIPLSALLYGFAVVVLAFAIYVGSLALATFGLALFGRGSFLGALIGLLVWGVFSYVVGYHALMLGVEVLNGLAGRFL